MKILWIAPYPANPRQHPAPWLITLAGELVNSGYMLHILTPSPKIKQVECIDTEHGYRLIRLPYQGGLLHLLSLFQTQIRALKKYLKENDSFYDIIHIHGTELQFASSMYQGTRVNQKPYIVSIQGIISLYKRELTHFFSKQNLYWTIGSFYEKKDIRRTKYFFCRTQWDKFYVESVNKTAVIVHCWELIRKEFFDYNHNFGGSDILFMGGNNPLKALNLCLMVFNEFVKSKNVKLHIVGLVNQTAVWNKIYKLKLTRISQDKIIFHGMIEAAAICQVYKQCYCLYHPSLIDNSPNSVCEALVAGLPVIATGVGGVPSLIEDGQTGLLVFKNDPEDHRKALEKLFNDDELKRALSSNAVKVARQRHDVNEIIDITIGAYQTVANEVFT